MINQQYKSIKTPVHHSHDNPMCSTCKSFIDDPTHRFLIVKDKNMKQKILSFHYSSPCWDAIMYVKIWSRMILLRQVLVVMNQF